MRMIAPVLLALAACGGAPAQKAPESQAPADKAPAVQRVPSAPGLQPNGSIAIAKERP